MSTYVVTYHGAGSPDPGQMQEAMAAFAAWLESNRSLVRDPGAPCRPVDQVSSGDPEPMAAIGGYSILEGSLTEVQAALATHPFVARGGTLQLNETVDPAALGG
jgi:hypothetical protein